ncbi:FANCM protein, partial [Bucco capensis]|nr:FANCM protein [Bucco capensis]
MSGGRQSTLPHAWWAAGGKAAEKKKQEKEKEEVEDDLLLVAAAAAADPIPAATDPSPAAGFCAAAGSIWIYPTNYPVRDYQVRMANASLLANTLVCLPTGLGKTFVAAVVMYNFYRWFPSGKVLFLAPTKPLVAQQMEAWGTQALNRGELWATRRVFFLTPQIMVNDLSRGTCPAVEIKCLVIDEAHKALGNHAYCQVVRELSKYSRHFRILALSATPGSDTKAVQQVISNLLIAQIELCAEDSPEIQPYSHERQVEKIVVPLGEELVEIQNAYIRVLEAFAGRLIKIGVLARRDVPSLTKYQIILARDQYRKNPSSQNMGMHQGVIEGDFALCISLYHGYELLLQMGLRSLFLYLCGIMDGSKGLTRTKNELAHNEHFVQLYQQLTAMFSGTALPSATANMCRSDPVFEQKKDFIYSHPKLRKLEEIVTEHFQSWKKRCSAEGSSSSRCVEAMESRVMIFSSFRDSVQEIAEMLSRLSPMVRVMTFVGHSTGKSTKGFTQKEQLEVVKRFREGGYNTLVSTCVGEEGLDIGEVDLIICFDAQKSPIRLVQRMGRTGRRRRGRIVLILAQGREERTYNQSQSNRRSIHKALSGNRTLHFYQQSPQMIPEGIKPKLHKMFITAEEYEPSNSRMLSKERRAGSLQHKSALFSCLPEQKQNCHQNWALSPEEFETWDRLYRIKESDGVKQPVLPQTCFETLENPEEISQAGGEAWQELSLCEWAVWQSRPFPTAAVEHSARCCHFISSMQLIEHLRHQQGDCSYELELQPHFHVEDVIVPRSRSHLSISSSRLEQKGSSSRKGMAHRPKAKAFVADPSEDGSELFSMFKMTKPKAPRRAPGLTWNTNTPAAPSESSMALPGSTGQATPEEEELQVTFDLNDSMELCATTEAPARAAKEECRAPDKACRSLGTEQADSGYGSFTAETSPVSPDLFYLPESYVDSFALGSPSEEPAGLKESLCPVKRLLAQPPPSWNTLDELESMMGREETPAPFPKGISERLQDKAFPGSSGAEQSVLLWEIPELRASPEPEPAAEAREELQWDDSLDSLFDSEEFPEIQEKTPAGAQPLRKKPPKEPFVQKEQDVSSARSKGIAEEQKSSHFFAGDHGSKASARGDAAGNGSKASARGDAAGNGSGKFPAEKESCVSTDRACKEQPCSMTATAMELALSEQLPEDGELSECSGELFSVNFDLGFSLEECEDEEKADAEESREFNSALRSPADGEQSKALHGSSRLETSPAWDLATRHISTPLPVHRRSRKGTEGAEDASTAEPCLEAGGRRAASASPEALPSALSTPTRRIAASRRIPLNIFSPAREEIPEKSPHRQDFRRSALDPLGSSLGRPGKVEDTKLPSCHVAAAGASSDSEEEIVFQRKNRNKTNVLKSPEVLNESDSESPVAACRKRPQPLNVESLKMQDPAQDAQTVELDALSWKYWCLSLLLQDAARQFLDEEAELSQQDAAEVSSDESDDAENELHSSLAQFLNDEVEITQVLNEGEMRGVYLQSVHSPALGSSYKMVHRHFNSMAIFSQIPEQDQSYAEDSFCVKEEEEEPCKKSESSEEEEVCVNFDLLENESFTGGRKHYLTRRRRQCKQARLEQSCSGPGHSKKPSRIIVLSDSSGEETTASKEKPMETGCFRAEQENTKSPKSLPSPSSVQHKKVAEDSIAHQPLEDKREMLLSLKASVSERLDFLPEHPSRSTHTAPAASAAALGREALQAPPEVEASLKNTCRSPSAPPGPAAPLCILADSREICSGAEVISCLKAAHGVKVQVCSLGTTDYLLSTSLAVDRRAQAELLNPASRSKLTQRIQSLQSMFDRSCVIVEKDRGKAGESSRQPHRTQYYDGVLAALIQAGVHILFSSSQEETAALLKDLALVEQRKSGAISVPTEVEGHKREMLNFYLTIPNLSYLAALNLCHHFPSVRKMVNSSPSAIAAGAQVSLQKAQEIYRYLHYGFDIQLLPDNLSAKGRGN